MLPAYDESSGDQSSVFVFSDDCSIPTSIVIMVAKRHWTNSEINAAAAAYLDATNNAIQGTDQPHDDFKMDLLERWLKLGPPDPGPDLWGNRLDNSLAGAAKLHCYIRDNIVKQLQKFNSSLRIVELSGVSGTSPEQNLNMAYAIYMKKTTTVEYEFKDFEICMWKLHAPYKILKDMPKLFFSAESCNTDNVSDLTRGRGNKKGNKAAKREEGQLKRQAFRDADRERRAKRLAQCPNDRQETNDHLAAVRNSLEQFTAQLEKKNQIKAIANEIKAVTVGLRTETDPQKRENLMARLSELQ
jgi:hypothetical protein